MNEGSIGADEAAELAALTRQMGAQGGQGGQPGQDPAGAQRDVPIPQYPPVDQRQAVPQGFDGGPQPTGAPAPAGVPQDPNGWASPADQGQQWQNPAPGGGQPQQHQSPPAAHVAERQRRQQAEQQANDLQSQLAQQRENQARLEERLAMLADVQARGQQSQLDQLQQQQLPAYEDDPEAYIRAMNERQVKPVLDRLEAVESENKRYKDALDQETYQRQIAAQLKAHADQFSQQQPDFRQAYDFYNRSRKEELTAQGFDPAAVNAYVDNEELMVAEAHINGGRNIAQSIYQAAQARGYRPNGQAPQQAPQQYQPQPGYQQAYQNQPVYQPAQAPAAMPQQQMPYQPAPMQAPAPQQPYYAGQPAMDTMQAGMMSGSHLADLGNSGGMVSTVPSLDQLEQMPEEQLMQNMRFVNAHIEGLKRAGH